jgi:hypothetical protein
MSNLSKSPRLSSITFACFKGVSFQSKLIKFWTRGDYSHTAYVVDDNSSFFNSIIEPVNNKYWDFSNIYNDHFPNTVIHYYSKSVTIDQKQIVDQFFVKLATNRAKYDWKGILGFVFKNPDNKSKFFCSEAATMSLIEAGIWPSSLRPYRVSPSYFVDLLLVSNFTLVHKVIL